MPVDAHMNAQTHANAQFAHPWGAHMTSFLLCAHCEVERR